jgi:pimeloyl-ACP methyl ester carboxylesterase
VTGAGERITTYEHDGLVFDVTDEGPLDGEVVVLLHGFPERATCWRDVAPLLHAEGYRTLAPDQRGYSPGARPRRRRDYRTALLARDVGALLRLAGAPERPVHLVGHDWGAIVAWTLAAAHPELLRTLTTLSVPHPRAYTRSLRGSTQALKSWYILAFQVPWLPELSARRPGGLFDRAMRGGGMTRDEVARFRAEIVDDGALPGGIAWYRGMPFGQLPRLGRGRKPAPSTGSEARDGMRRVRVPTTLIWSDGDRFVDRASAEICHEFVAAPFELVVLEGVDHWIPTHAPREAADAILARVASASDAS